MLPDVQARTRDMSNHMLRLDWKFSDVVDCYVEDKLAA